MTNTATPITLTHRGRIVRDLVAGAAILAVALFFTQIAHAAVALALMALPFAQWFAVYATPVVIPVVVASVFWALIIHAEGK